MHSTVCYVTFYIVFVLKSTNLLLLMNNISPNTEGSTVSKVFGSRAYERYRYDLTLLEATSRNDDGDNVFARLVKESTAALINSYTRKGFPYSAWEVKTAVIEGMVSGEAAAEQARRFYDANRNCN